MAGEIQRKTATNSAEEELAEIAVIGQRSLSVKEKLAKENFYNVLNSYRSYNYVITIAALDPVKFNDPQSYRTTEDLENVILKSSGKGKNGTFSPIVISTTAQRVFSGLKNEKDRATLMQTIEDEIETFNKESAGRFDLYINNLEIKTIPIPNRKSGNTIVTGIQFEVYEPFSIVGFLEALRAAGLAYGYLNYLEATFLMKIEFVGYDDEEELPDPTTIEKSTRYIPFKFTKVDVDVGIKGTIYKCNAIPVESMTLADVDGSLNFSMQLATENNSNKVEDILTKFFKDLNEENLKAFKESSPGATVDDINRYYIKFPKLVDGKYNTDEKNDIANADVTDLEFRNNIYKFDDINTTNKRTAYRQEGNPVEVVPFEPTKSVAQFAQGSYYHNIITSVIRDSSFWVKQFSTDSEGKVTINEDDEFFYSWKIIPIVEIRPKYSEFARKSLFDVTYYVIPEKRHISTLPGRGGDIYNSSNINIVREYNYIYSGQNVDIISLRLNFDKLFYERFPVSLGANDRVPFQNTAGPQDSKNVTAEGTGDPRAAIESPGGSPTVAAKPVDTVVTPHNAGAPSLSAENYLARQYFDSMLTSSNLSMLSIEMEIVGDPLYITTGGIGNYLPTYDPVNPAFTTDGEADFISQLSHTKIYFTHPTDVDETDINDGGTGLLKFQNSKIKFSGVYLLKEVVSRFKEGRFTQIIKANRLPFAVTRDEYETPKVNTERYKSTPNPEDKRTEDAGKNKIVPQDKQTSLKDLLNGVNRFADSLQSAEARIVGAIQGGINDLTSSVSGALQPTANAIAASTNRIQGKLQGLNNAVVDASNKIGLRPNELASLSAGEIAAALAISKLLPDNVNFEQARKNGIVIPNKEDIGKLPPLENLDKLADAIYSSRANEYTEFFNDVSTDIVPPNEE